MPIPTNNVILNTIQQMLQALTEDVSDLKKTLPSTYVSIRSHDQDIKALDIRLGELQARIAAIEAQNRAGTQWANDAHLALKNEFLSEIRTLGETIATLQTNSTAIQIQVATAIKVAVWIAAIPSGTLIVVIGAYVTHVIH